MFIADRPQLPAAARRWADRNSPRSTWLGAAALAVAGAAGWGSRGGQPCRCCGDQAARAGVNAVKELSYSQRPARFFQAPPLCPTELRWGQARSQHLTPRLAVSRELRPARHVEAKLVQRLGDAAAVCHGRRSRWSPMRHPSRDARACATKKRDGVRTPPSCSWGTVGTAQCEY